MRYLLDGALSTVDPQNRREKALWMLDHDANPEVQLSFMTPINVLLANPTLDGGDVVVLRRLLAQGGRGGVGVARRRGIAPLAQLEGRDLEGSARALLREVLTDHATPLDSQPGG